MRVSGIGNVTCRVRARSTDDKKRQDRIGQKKGWNGMGGLLNHYSFRKCVLATDHAYCAADDERHSRASQIKHMENELNQVRSNKSKSSQVNVSQVRIRWQVIMTAVYSFRAFSIRIDSIFQNLDPRSTCPEPLLLFEEISMLSWSRVLVRALRCTYALVHLSETIINEES